MKKVIRKRVASLPNTGIPIDYAEMPIIEAKDYLERIHNLFDLAGKEITHFLIYADREHFSNFEFFTGYDPRFEEALLILSPNTLPTIVVGNEGYYAVKIPYDIKVEKYPTFSLPNQPRDSSISLTDILNRAGFNKESRIGLIGWKLFDEKDFKNPPQHFDFPYFIMQELLQVVNFEQLINITSLMVGGDNGLRNKLDAKELVLCEISGTRSSRNTLKVLQSLREGITELEASAALAIDGEPLSVHPNINFGSNTFLGLASPTAHTKLKRGDLVGAGMAYRRSMCHKVSYYVESASELKPGIENIYDRYFLAITAWYESLGDGATGGEVYNNILKIISNLNEFGISLNLGHLIHTDEWTSSPFYENSKVALHSGMALQCDFTASIPELGVSVHAEDGLILADENMRNEIARIAPLSYERMQNRRKFMRDELGINIAPEVLPTSDLPAVVFPYLCNLQVVLANSNI